MSAAGTVERLRTPEGVAYVARVFLGMDLALGVAERYVLPLQEISDRWGWMQSSDAVSAGPVLYLKARMMDDGLYEWERPSEPDDLPIIMTSDGPKICPVARSKLFRSMLKTEPIDLVSGRVAGFDRLKTRPGSGA